MSDIYRETVHGSDYPDLVVIYLGARVSSPRGLLTLLRFRRLVRSAVASNPEGLLCHEPLLYSGFPLHLGMRQYWRNLECLLAWANSSPHQQWSDTYGPGGHGVGFWHEIFLASSAVDAVYLNMPDIGLKRAAKVTSASEKRRLPPF